MPKHAEMVGVLLSEAGPPPWLPVSPSRCAAGASRGASGDEARASEGRKRHHHGCPAQEAGLLAVRGWETEVETQARTLTDASGFRERQSTAIIRMHRPLLERRDPR
jgi:hypothetical protein